MSNPRIQRRPTLDALIARARAYVESLSPEQLEAMLVEQKKSWARGEMGLSESSVVAKPRQTAEPTTVTDIRRAQRRVNRARKFPMNTCPASRHVHIMADVLASGDVYHMFTEEPRHCAESLYAVLESLWKLRTELANAATKR